MSLVTSTPTLALACATGLLLGLVHPAEGVIFLSTADPAYNTTPPEGALLNSGWQYQGIWGPFSGTVVGPRHFLTGAHVGGVLGQIFIFQGREYTTTGFVDDPTSDLRLWKVCGQFPQFASFYERKDELGKSLVVFGRGTQRGDPVLGNDGELKGWRWGAADGLQRWGENTVEQIVTEGSLLVDIPGAGGNLLKALFERGKGENEAHLSSGDSGGGVFIQDGAVWKLAGVNLAVDGAYNTSDNGPGFNAAIFDEGGLYKGKEGNWSLVLDLPVDRPGGFYATRISSNLAWLRSILNDASAGDPDLSVESAPAVTGPFSSHAAEVNTSTRTILISLTGETEFFRLRGCGSARITGVSRGADGRLILHYDAGQTVDKS